MSGQSQTVEDALRRLVELIARPYGGDPTEIVNRGPIPDDLKREGFTGVGLRRDEQDELELLRVLLQTDLRFEHMRDAEVKDSTWRFVCKAHTDAKGLVPEFVAEHAGEPMLRTCFLPVDLLAVSEPVELFGVTLLPPAAVELPPHLLIPGQRPQMLSVVAVESRGTSHNAMADRARVVAERALRLLRATLREDRWLPDRQLRFRLGHAAWFDDNAGGWDEPPGAGWDLELDSALLRHATSQPISTLPDPPTNDVEDRVDLALRWYERAQLEAEPNISLLYLFSALESILGDTSEGLKATKLAVRRAMLGLLTRGGFTHPAPTYLLYKKVRSTAVHGERAPEISEKERDGFAWDVRAAINEYLEFARQHGLTERKHVRRALDQNERRDGVVRGLIRDNPKLWKDLTREAPGV